MHTQVALLTNVGGLTMNFGANPITTVPEDRLPASVPAGLMEKIRTILPKGLQIQEFGIFKRRAVTDPVIAVKIAGQWFSLYSWE